MAKKLTKLEKRLRKKFDNPRKILNIMSEFINEGDIDSCVDLVFCYMRDSRKYKGKEKFAKAAKVTQADLQRLLVRDKKIQLKVFFAAIEQIRKDAE